MNHIPELISIESQAIAVPERYPFPDFIDSTMISLFRACPQAFYMQFIRRKVSKDKSIHLIAGGAFAKGLEVARRAFYDGGLSAEDAVVEGVRALMLAYPDLPEMNWDNSKFTAKHVTNMVEALVLYFKKWPLDQDYLVPVKRDGKSWVEFSFALPTGVSHPVTGAPILFVGRCDMIGRFNNDIYTEDDKTCSQMGPAWQNQWDMRGQFIGYVKAARDHGFKVIGSITRGTKLTTNVIEFGESIDQFPAWQVDRWEQQLERDLTRMIRAWGDDWWDFAYNDACTAYGGCQYKKLCRVPNPQSYINVYFEDYTWSPLAKGDD